MAKKGDTYNFICENIIEVTPDGIMYNIKEDTGGYCRYIEKRYGNHLIEGKEYSATVGNITMRADNKSCYLLTEIYINSINDDTIKDRLAYKIIRRLL